MVYIILYVVCRMRRTNMDFIKESLDRYVNNKVSPGSFLLAVLQNDLKESFSRADHINRNRLFEIVSYCYNNIPETCWGSPEKVHAWLNPVHNSDDSI